MKKGLFVLWLSIFGWQTNAQQPARIEAQSGKIVLNFVEEATKSTTQPFIVQRAKGRLGNYETIGTGTGTSYTDHTAAGNPYDYYYKIIDAQGRVISRIALDTELFGPNLFIFSPDDNKSAIADEINSTHDAMFSEQFSLNRYAYFFKPGDYTAAGKLKVSYYMHIGGLGSLPTDVKLSNIETPATLSNNNATCTFWRSAENFSVVNAGSSGNFFWSVSQAAPLRRVYSERNTQYDYNGGNASGGFTADCYFNASMGSHSQQQWYTRNSYIENGSNAFSAGGWNFCYQGVEFGSRVNMNNHSDNWTDNAKGWGNVSRVELTPVIREKPFLFVGEDGKYKVFRPALRKDVKGISWSETGMGAGAVYDLETDFYVVKPGTTAATMNGQLEAGKHLFITPGQYILSEPLHITHPNTIVLGTGYATLVPTNNNNQSLIRVDDVDGVTVAGLLLESRYSTQTLMEVGETGACKNHSENPVLLADLVFRIGGVYNENVSTEVALIINSSDVIGDHFWIWRADHGTGVGWNRNVAKNGLIVNGHYVTLYGLFNEHFQEYGTIWKGEKGRTYFYQNETPYDVPNQSAYMSHDGAVEGYAQYKVDDQVQYHEAYMLGMYDVFIRTGGNKISIENSMEVPDSKGVKVHHICNVRISNNNMGGFKSILNGRVQSTYYTSGQGKRYNLLDFVGTQEPEPFIRPCDETDMDHPAVCCDKVIYPNPVNGLLHFSVSDPQVQVTVIDLQGKMLHQQTGTHPILMTTYEKGVYLIRLQTSDGQVKSLKAVKR